MTPLHPFVKVYFILKFDTNVFEFIFGFDKDSSKYTEVNPGVLSSFSDSFSLTNGGKKHPLV